MLVGNSWTTVGGSEVGVALATGPQLIRRYRKHEMNVILFDSLVLIIKTGLSREKWTVN